MNSMSFRSPGAARSRLFAHCFCGSATTVLAYTLFLASPALAQNICGIPAAGEVTCSDTSLNSYETGISYDTTDSLALRIENGIIVDRTDAAQSGPAISVRGQGNAPLSLTIDPGVIIYTNKIHNNGIHITSASGPVTVNSAANIFVDFPQLNFSPYVPTNGIFGHISSATSQDALRITHQSGAMLSIVGEDSTGIYALQDGLGSVSVDVMGRIGNGGYSSMGALGTIHNQASTASLIMNLYEGGDIQTRQ